MACRVTFNFQMTIASYISGIAGHHHSDNHHLGDSLTAAALS
jgi:hypothetical protein